VGPPLIFDSQHRHGNGGFGPGPASHLPVARAHQPALLQHILQIIDVGYSLNMATPSLPPRYTFFVAGEEGDMNLIRTYMTEQRVTPLFSGSKLALKDSLQQAVRCASRKTRVTHALLLTVEPTMLLHMFMEKHATRSDRYSTTGIDLHRCPVQRYGLQYVVQELTANDLLFSLPRSPSPY
jgi:hypothetical protein